MKNIKLFSLGLFSALILLTSCGSDAQTDVFVPDYKNEPNGIEVINFYGTHRCTTCKDIESNTRYTLNTYFKDEVQNNTIRLKIIDVDDEHNYGIASHFEAAGTAFYLNVIKEGVATKIDLTDFGFKTGSDKEAFSTELKYKIEHELKKL